MKKLLFALLLASVTGFAQQDPYWHKIPSGTQKKLLSIDFGNTTTGYIGGEDSLLLKTSDGGASWQPVNINSALFTSAATDVVDVNFLTADLGYITVSNYENPLFEGIVYKTTNGGSSWSFVDAGNIAARRSFFFTEGEGFVIGAGFFSGNVISKITAGLPSDYHYFSDFPNRFNIAVDFRNTLTGIVSDNKGRVYRTNDGGIHWDTLSSGSDTAIYAVKFLNDSTLLAAALGTLLISFDTGSTWQTEMNSLTFDYPVMQGMALSGKDSFIAVGHGITNPDKGLIYWHDHTFNRRELVEQPLHGVAMRNDSIAYAVGDSGLIVTNRPAPVTGLITPGLLMHKLKVYPNPSSGLLFTELPYTHKVLLRDILGRTVIQQEEPAFRQVLDLTGLVNGIYFAEVATQGQHINRKIILTR